MLGVVLGPVQRPAKQHIFKDPFCYNLVIEDVIILSFDRVLSQIIISYLILFEHLLFLQTASGLLASCHSQATSAILGHGLCHDHDVDYVTLIFVGLTQKYCSSF